MPGPRRQARMISVGSSPVPDRAPNLRRGGSLRSAQAPPVVAERVPLPAFAVDEPDAGQARRVRPGKCQYGTRSTWPTHSPCMASLTVASASLAAARGAGTGGRPGHGSAGTRPRCRPPPATRPAVRAATISSSVGGRATGSWPHSDTTHWTAWSKNDCACSAVGVVPSVNVPRSASAWDI